MEGLGGVNRPHANCNPHSGVGVGVGVGVGLLITAGKLQREAKSGRSMDSSFKISTPTPTRPSKRLLFDRRYGFVFDEWKEPSEVALAGGRGMFCIVPLGKSLLERASESVNSTASCIINVLQKPDRLSPQILQATLTDHFHNFASSLRKPESYFLGLSGILPVQPRHGPSHSLTGTESKTDQ